MTMPPTDRARDFAAGDPERDEAYYLAALIGTLRTHFAGLAVAAQEGLDRLEEGDLKAVEETLRYIKLKAHGHAPPETTARVDGDG